ncbi:MAG TPA: RNA-binding S4 domain-containing protein [Candidatus Rifleibacterium sp.]|mgnify:FL=1|nr:RNA-binding S4 domain-containing protein [Candidatus Rifleibacterium sp.]HPT47295.1 RNA-binding S4 domain-containing protein [Candidatus Rifleibacterium sp.]
MNNNKSVQTFELTEDFIELIKLIKFMGLSETGGQAKLLVERGMVKVDGELESRKRRKVRKGMTVTVGDETINVI